MYAEPVLVVLLEIQRLDFQVFSLELINQQFNNAFAIGNNIATSDGTITLELPAVPVG